MNKKLFSVALMGVLLSAGTFVSCTDYDDDIASLQEQINKTNATIESLQSSIAAGSVITSVAAAPNGVIVTLSNGNSFTITNGKDGENGVAGKDGSVVEIRNGNWFINGEDTGLAAQGVKGEAGVAGADGNDGAYWEPREDGYFWKVEADGTQTKGISWMKSNGVTAVMDANTITFYNVAGSNGPIVVSLDANLASMVYMPTLYLDGIEATKYTYMENNILKESGQLETIDGRVNYNGAPQKKIIFNEKYVNDYDGTNAVTSKHEHEYVGSTTVWHFAPAQALQYHVNPANAKIEAEDIVGFNVLNPEILQTKSASTLSKLDAKAVAKGLYVDYLIQENYNTLGYSKKDFGNVAGVLNIGLEINAWEMEDNVPTTADMPEVNQNGYVAALQMKSKDTEKPVITSDYALILPVKRSLIALNWVLQPMYRADAATAEKAYPCRMGDITKPCHGDARVHVYETPEEALQDKNGAALEIDWAETDFDLTKYLGICFEEEVYTSNGSATGIEYKTGVMTYGQEAPYGLYYDFERVNYSMDGNVTHESDFIREDQNNKGHYSARNVEARNDRKNAPQVEEQSETEVDREPLIRVMVKNNENQVVLEGYILFHITRELPNTTITKYPIGGKVFDPCNDVTLLQTTWSQFNDYVLTDRLNNMTKVAFDASYVPDLDAAGNMRIFKNAPEKGDDAIPYTGVGIVKHNTDGDGTTNHTYTWTITKEEYEALTHDHNPMYTAENPLEVKIYVRYKAIDPTSSTITKYNYIFIELRANLWRNMLTPKPWAEKINNYWYGFDYSDDNGWDVIRLDVEAPRNDLYMWGSNGTTSVPMTHKIHNTLVKNTVSADIKYYFVPDETISVTTQLGNTYKLVTDSKLLICNFVAGNNHVFNRNTLVEDLSNCSINAGGTGVFTNNKLYAEIGNTKYLIAELDQNPANEGKITLHDNAVAKELLNAIGYPEYTTSDARKTFATWIGVITEKCEAKPLEDDIFLASWERPINMLEPEDKVAIDANTNENIIYLLDVLKLYDWRGPVEGYMYDDQQWFWAYYGVNELTIDFENMTTNMHQANKDNFVKMSTITKKARIWGYKNGAVDTSNVINYNFNILSYNSASRNADLLSYMAANKDMFGAIYYENNGDNVTDFAIKVPVTVSYFWGDFHQVVTINISRTTGN